MSANETEIDGTYCIETKVNAGKIADPVTGEEYVIEPYEDEHGGTIEVPRADSAKYMVERSARMEFVGEGPTESEVRKAQDEVFGFSESEHARKFAESRGVTFGTQELDPSEGFDPETDPANNGPRIKVWKAYDTLQSDGREDEAGYLRALPSEARQEQFAKFLQDAGVVSL